MISLVEGGATRAERSLGNCGNVSSLKFSDALQVEDLGLELLVL